MANVTQKFYQPQDASIDKLVLNTAAGSIDLKYLMVELSYFEDIYSFVVSGYILVRDGVGLVEKFQLSGKETLELSFGKFSDPTRKTQTFRVYSIPDRNPVAMTSEFIKLHFCSEELFLSEQTKILKAYGGNMISDIIKDILNKIKVPTDKINQIENTTGLYDFNIPTLKPFDAISWLSTYARPAGNDLVGADMLFYETKEGFNFRSLNSLYKQNIHNTYKYEQQNLPSSEASMEDDVVSVLDYEFVRTFDNLNDVSSGAFANRLITIDPLTRSRNVKDFDYSQYRGNRMNDGTLSNDVQNRLGKKQNQTYEGTLKLMVGNSNQRNTGYISPSALPAGSIAKDIFAETFVPNRTAQLALANHTVIKIRIPGDPFITAGKTVQFNLLSLFGGKDRTYDEMYSGKYLVSAVRHVVQSQGVFQTVLELVKESTPEQASPTLYNDGISISGTVA